MANDLVKLTETYPVLAGAGDVLAVVEANLQGESISAFDLEQIKVPGGGSLSWQSSAGEETKVVEGIIVHHKLPRGRWETSIEESGGGQPPVCYSDDSITGHGDPGGDCHSCPYAEFGTADKGEGQACKQRRLLFILQPGNLLPAVVSIPATGLKAAKQYLVALISKGVAVSALTTHIKLEKAQNKAGIAHARPVFEMGERLGPEAATEIAVYAAKMKPILDAVRLEEAPTEGGE